MTTRRTSSVGITAPHSLHRYSVVSRTISTRQPQQSAPNSSWGMIGRGIFGCGYLSLNRPTAMLAKVGIRPSVDFIALLTVRAGGIGAINYPAGRQDILLRYCLPALLTDEV